MVKILGQRDLVIFLASILDKAHINYLLTGSLAVSYYGLPRATHDIDFIVQIKIKDSWKILKAGKSLGKSFLIDNEQVNEAISERSQFNIFHTYTGIKIDFWIVEKNEFEKSKFKRKKIIFIDKQKVNLISAEDLILNKLLWCKEIKSERHMNDCAGILNVQKDRLNKDYLNFWLKKLNLNELFREVLLLKKEES